MSSKTKIAVATLGVVLVLAVIGLTIGLVLVASQGVVTNSMTVTYSATNVACTISAEAYHYDREDTKGAAVEANGSTSVTFNAGDKTAAGTISFKEAQITDNGEGYVLYTFTITNAATAEKAIKAVASEPTAGTNMTVTVDDSGAANIAAAGGTGTITVKVEVTDSNASATWTEAALTITVTQA